MKKLKREFVEFYGDALKNNDFEIVSEALDPIVDNIHRNLKPKISVVGFSGVGKTTTTRLIKSKEIPMQHIPTITGEVATIKIGKLNFFLWDFAGQDQFDFLWEKFIRGSDAVLLMTDSTLENLEKSLFFNELVKKAVPYARFAIIGNKQDLPDAMKVEDIERLMG
ncbi:MAG: ADP-ribosylation factor-like protein, partial [Promethearchaeota archaeon]